MMVRIMMMIIGNRETMRGNKGDDNDDNERE